MVNGLFDSRERSCRRDVVKMRLNLVEPFKSSAVHRPTQRLHLPLMTSTRIACILSKTLHSPLESVQCADFSGKMLALLAILPCIPYESRLKVEISPSLLFHGIGFL